MDNHNLITIFTPCYNRASLLPQLYASLVSQSSHNFEWVIVDDGSTDNSKQVIEQFILENKFPIHYHYKPNGGKHTAINVGVNKANGTLFFIVDSDDFLSNDAVKITNDAFIKIKDNDKIGGIIGLSQFTNGAVVGDNFLHDYWQISFADYYLKYNLKGDKSVAFKTKIMKEFPFPEKEGVKYVFEAVVWHEMAKKYDVLCLNDVIQYKEYLDGGLSDSSYKLWYLKSMAFSFFKLIENDTYPIAKYPIHHKSNFLYLAVNSLLSNENYFWEMKGIKNKMYYIFSLPRACFTYFKLKNKVIK
ncbi:glycosyltransferase family 2 protein [Flavobacterium sp.]|uniref:glycosyltransferase family 2 protein n=1 Tax=Flavobacterium sp. TaxID=239 RepID=UPI003750AC36